MTWLCRSLSASRPGEPRQQNGVVLPMVAFSSLYPVVQGCLIASLRLIGVRSPEGAHAASPVESSWRSADPLTNWMVPHYRPRIQTLAFDWWRIDLCKQLGNGNPALHKVSN
eukprot:SM000022S07225  [mRNA]  locus=s22:600541:603118:+ [translate_table: standard]